MNETARDIEAVRRFNRFYTRKIGVLQEGLLNSPFSLAEARVIYEIANCGRTTATELCQELGLDAGYLSRILRGLQRRGVIGRKPSRTDSRRRVLSMTEGGMGTFAKLDAESRSGIGSMLAPLSRQEQRRLVGSMEAIQGLLETPPEQKTSYLLRPHQPGDMGWVVHRHGVLYNHEYGWNEEFEALVAEIVAKFIREFDPKRERCWIAERDGEMVGSVFLVKKTESTAQLRLLLVEPKARGLGIGKRLVRECTRFAQARGYNKIMLWTNSVLEAARGIYQREGYRLVREEPHHSFGGDWVGQFFELDLPALDPSE